MCCVISGATIFSSQGVHADFFIHQCAIIQQVKAYFVLYFVFIELFVS